MIEVERSSRPSQFRLKLSAWRAIARKIDLAHSRIPRRTRALYSLNGSIQSVLHRLQKSSYAEALAKTVPKPPIFILGFWRSGTTFLHELLCCNSRFGFPSTYACLNPSHFLLSEAQMRKHYGREVVRPMDQMRYSWASPQEDEFALLGLGASSPYEALLVPSLMHNPCELLDLGQRPAEEQARWWNTFDHFLRLLTIQQGKPMLLKSPTHGYRMRILQDKFPRARFVIIDRNPYEVFASNLKLWRTLIDRYALESCPASQLENFILAAYLIHEKAISEGVQHAAPGSLARIRYENLEKNPLEQICYLYKTLGLEGFEEVCLHLEKHLAKVSGHERNRFQFTRAQKLRVDEAWGTLIAQKNYDWPNAYLDLE